MTLARVYQTVMGAAQKHYDAAGGKDQGADAYMTLVGYFNALRELGAMRRVVEDEVPQRTVRIDRGAGRRARLLALRDAAADADQRAAARGQAGRPDEEARGQLDRPNPRAGLQVVEFPRWMVCQGCSAMVQASTSLTVKDGRYQHPCASGKPSVLVPVRFVVVCPSGHLDEFPWVDFVHFYGRGEGGLWEACSPWWSCARSRTSAISGR